MSYSESSVSGLQAHLRSIVRCPVDWSFISSLGMRSVLHEEWEDLAAEFSRREDALRTSHLFRIDGIPLETETDPLILSDHVATLERWIEAARDEYRRLTLPLTRMHVATDLEYHKHFPGPNDTTMAIRKRSKKDSCFYRGITRDHLTDYMWDLFEYLWEEIRFKNIQVYTNALAIIGASGGEDVELMRWNISFSTSIAHAYPVSPLEVAGKGKTAYPVSDRLQGVAQMDY